MDRLKYPAPQWLLDLLHENRPGPNGNGPRPAAADKVPEHGGDGWAGRDAFLTSMGGAMRRYGFSEEAIYLALRHENAERCEPPLPDEVVRVKAHSVARYDPDPLAHTRIVLPGEAPPDGPEFAAPVPASKLRAADPDTLWLWDGYLARGGTTLLTALWKAGKTTLLAHLLRALETGGAYCGRAAAACRVLYVTEEGESRWAERRDKLGLADHVEFLARPFVTKPDSPKWLRFLEHLGGLLAARRFDLLVMDTISNLWPVQDENNACQVQSSLMPLPHALGSTAALLVHHPRKGDGQEATASRGSGALTAFCDTIIEMRRFTPGDRSDHRRVLTGYGRADDTPGEIVVELTDAGYVHRGEREEVAAADLVPEVLDVLPLVPPGMTAGQAAGLLGQRAGRVAAAVTHAHESNLCRRTGAGTRGSPYMYYRTPES
jgi:AAA domain/Primase C terminal 1 (PriCT-1)